MYIYTLIWEPLGLKSLNVCLLKSLNSLRKVSVKATEVTWVINFTLFWSFLAQSCSFSHTHKCVGCTKLFSIWSISHAHQAVSVSRKTRATSAKPPKSRFYRGVWPSYAEKWTFLFTFSPSILHHFRRKQLQCMRNIKVYKLDTPCTDHTQIPESEI